MFSKLFKKRSPVEIIGIVVIFLLLLAIIGTFILYGVFKDTNTAPKMFGYRVYIMNGEGMEPRIPKGSAVFVNEGTEGLGEGKVVLCSIDGTLAVVGYVSSENVVTADGTTQVRHLVKYDKGAADEVWGIGEDDIIGVAKTYSKGFGGLVNFASSKAGMLLIVIIPCALLMAYELVMLFITRKNKPKNEIPEEAEEDPDAEIARLREEIMRSRKKAEEAHKAEVQPKPQSKDEMGGTKAFKLEFTSDKKDEPKDEPLEFKSDKKAVTDKTIQLRASKPEPKPQPTEPQPQITEPQLQTTEKLEFTSKPEPKAEPAIDVTKMTSSDIDELIRMLEAEKSRLESK